MKITCAEIDLLLCDYVDGALDQRARAEVDSHLAACPSCAAVAQDAAAAVRFMDRVPEPEPPAALITRILFHTQNAPAALRAALHPQASLLARLRHWVAGLLEPILQPRFAMGMAMTILSFSMIGRFAGISPRQITSADLDPVKIWTTLDDKVHRGWDRAVKYYENLKVVYEIQATLNEWSAQEEEDRRAQQIIQVKSSKQDQSTQQDSGTNEGDKR